MNYVHPANQNHACTHWGAISKNFQSQKNVNCGASGSISLLNFLCQWDHGTQIWSRRAHFQAQAPVVLCTSPTPRNWRSLSQGKYKGHEQEKTWILVQKHSTEEINSKEWELLPVHSEHDGERINACSEKTKCFSGLIIWLVMKVKSYCWEWKVGWKLAVKAPESSDSCPWFTW